VRKKLTETMADGYNRLLVVVIVVLLLLQFGNITPSTPRWKLPPKKDGPSLPDKPSIAVLPLHQHER